MRRLLGLIFLLLCFVTLAPLAPAVTAAPAEPDQQPVTLPGEFMGMVVRDPHYEWKTNPKYAGTNQAFYDIMGANLAAAGVKWVRIEFFAEEATPAAGEPDLRGRVNTAKYSYFLNTVAPRYGFKVIGLLATPLVRDQNGQYLDPETIEEPLDLFGGENYGYVNPYMKIWLDNALAVAKAFPYNKQTGAGVAAFEILNEENRYLNGGGKGLKPDAVATMLTKFYRLYKNVECPKGTLGANCADVRLLLGGLHPDRCDDCVKSDGTRGMTDRQYLDTLYKSGAFQGFRTTNGRYPVDGVGYHPYPMEMRSGLLPEPSGSNDLFRIPQRMRQIRQVMINNGDLANKLWVTEIGDRGAPTDLDNQRRQAYFMQSVYWTLWQQREYIETVLWFKYEDFAVPANPAASGPENWGVVRLVPRTPTPECPTCEYDPNGTVQVFKEVFSTYAAMANSAIGLQTERIYFPIILAGAQP